MMGVLVLLLLVGLVAAGVFGMGTGSRSEPTSRSHPTLTESEAIEGLKAQYLNGEIDLAEFETRAERVYAEGTGEMDRIESSTDAARRFRSTAQNTQSPKPDNRPQGSKQRGPGCKR